MEISQKKTNKQTNKTLYVTMKPTNCSCKFYKDKSYVTILSKAYPHTTLFPIYNTNLPLLESPSSIKNKWLFSKHLAMARTQAFVERVKELKLEPKDTNIYFDVSALFTSIPVSEALTVVRELLESDKHLKEMTCWRSWSGPCHSIT